MNAIILAAGKSTRFAPFTYERPKGLFCVKGEILVERQISQLIEAGVENIYIVVGYMKEKFFYLERKYPNVHLLINNKFGVKGNLYSLYVAKDYLQNSFVSYADYYYKENPFLEKNPENISYHACVYTPGQFDSFSLDYSDANVITNVDLGGTNKMAMIGHAYLNENFAKRFVSYMEAEINEFRVDSLFWEEYFLRHIKELTMFAKPLDADEVTEFNSIDNLLKFDTDFLYNIDSEIITNICNTLHCEPNNIKEIAVINAGLTNVSFKFKGNGTEYVYRHPGGTANNLINRETEIYIQQLAKDIGIDTSFITMSEDGWKLSYCIQNLTSCDFRKNPQQLQQGLEQLRKLHNVPVAENTGVKDFDNLQESLKLMRIASLTKGNLLTEFTEEIEKATRLDKYLKDDAKRLGISRCYCHNDIYEPNFLATESGDLYLIDWEYAGINDPANDLAGLYSRYDYTEDQIEYFIKEYLGDELTEDLYNHYWAHIPLSALYWISWGLYKGSVGEEDGFFFLPSYRIFHKYIDKALALFEKGNQK